jgi:hypothetical protein
MKCAAVFFFALGLTITAWAQSPPPTPIPLDFFGIHMNVGPSNFLTPVPPPIVVGAGGKGAVTNWPYLETARGTYNWGALDDVTIFNTNTGRPVFEGYQEQPLWAVSDATACSAVTLGINSCPAPPSDLFTSATCQTPLATTTTTDCQFKEFITSMVNRYKHTGIQDGCTAANPQCNGVIAMYEFWNEPPFALGSGTCTVGTSCMPLASFVQMASDWYYTIKGIDSLAQVCSPAFIISSTYPSYGTFMSSFLSSGGAAIPFDCWDFHINETTPEAQIADIATFTGYLSANGISNPRLYATEAGRWDVGNCDAIAAADEQAYAGRIELIYWSQNVKAHYWYAYSKCAPLSDLSTNSTLTPLGIGYGNVESWMVGSTMTSPCALSGSFWTCGLTLANGQQALAAWYPVFQSAATANYTPASQYTQWHDLNGNTGAISGAMAIGESPVLLEAGGGVQMQDFTIAANPLTVTVTGPGQSGTTTLAVTLIAGFNQNLGYSCSGLPSEATCSFTATSLFTETLTITAPLPQNCSMGWNRTAVYSMQCWRRDYLVCRCFRQEIASEAFTPWAANVRRNSGVFHSFVWAAEVGAAPSTPSNLRKANGQLFGPVAATASGTNPLSNTVTIPVTVQ